jgi:hypothetical protein
VTREQLLHLLRASAQVLHDRGAEHLQGELVVIGSQSILGQYPGAPAGFTRSMEVDIYPLRDPAMAEYIDGALGEGSVFHRTYGYYAQGVAPETATLPAGWRERLIEVVSPARIRAVGLCIEVHDLAISKYVAGRDKDLEFNHQLARYKLARKSVLLDRLAATELDDERRRLVRGRIALHFRVPGR